VCVWVGVGVLSLFIADGINTYLVLHVVVPFFWSFLSVCFFCPFVLFVVVVCLWNELGMGGEMG